MKPQHVYIENGKATICGIPDADHNCDAMGCSSLEHVLCRTTFEQAPKPPAEWMDAVAREIVGKYVSTLDTDDHAGFVTDIKQRIALHAPKVPEGFKLVPVEWHERILIDGPHNGQGSYEWNFQVYKNECCGNPYWLIEHGSPAQWWVGNFRAKEEWTTDSFWAMRFVSKQMAEMEIKKLVHVCGVKGSLIATDHLDVAAAPKSDAAPDV